MQKILMATLPFALIACASLNAQTPPQCAEGKAGAYSVTIDSATRDFADIDAVLSVPDGKLRMSTGASDHLPEHWATFVQNLRIADLRGRALPFVHDTVAGWKVTSPAKCVRLRYRVDLRHSHQQWPPGNEQGAFAADSTLYTVTKALFIYAPVEGERLLRIKAPAAWRISAPWVGGRTGYAVPTLESLVDNSIVLGYQQVFDVATDSFTISVALVGSITRDSALMRTALDAPLRSYLELFHTRLAGRYLVTVFYGDEDDGESFDQSAAFRTPGPLTVEGKVLWANTFAHELFHYWNGSEISGADYAQSQWFSEGFTEYFANRALARSHVIPVADFLKLAAFHLGHYEYFRSAPAFDSVSVLNSGARKTTYRFGVYDGGWAIALWLDDLIRSETHDTKSLDDLMRGLHQNFGLTGRKYSYSDIVAAASDVAGRSLDKEFSKYVAGEEILPLAEILRHVGLIKYSRPYAAEFYLVADPAADPAALERRQQLFGF
jgi:predicted metalloprotease with PDZ domain